MTLVFRAELQLQELAVIRSRSLHAVSGVGDPDTLLDAAWLSHDQSKLYGVQGKMPYRVVTQETAEGATTTHTDTATALA